MLFFVFDPYSMVWEVHSNYKLDLVIYYKGTKTKNYIIKNSLSNNSILQMFHLVYKINCPVEDCELPKPYNIGQTQFCLTSL